MDIFKAETLNKVNARRLQDLEKFDDKNMDPVEKIDNSVFDFLNRESSKKVINSRVDGNDEGKRLLVSNDILLNY
jgi:hypothetical protein